jgi:hypothetical protein
MRRKKTLVCLCNEGNKNTNREAAVMLLLMGVICEIHRRDGISGMLYTEFHVDWYRRSSNIKAAYQKPERLQCWYY